MSAKLKDVMSPAEFREFMAKKEAGKTSKYKAIPTETQDGQKFKSALEANYYKRCWALQQVGEVTKIEREVRYELVVNGHFVAAYMMDFRITYRDGRVDHIDCKSDATLTPLYRIKKQLMKAIHGIDLIEVFQDKEEFSIRTKPGERGRKK